ncbi:MAG: hypothetical protein ACK4OM_00130 [Alphaproteobacteria bacterium]
MINSSIEAEMDEIRALAHDITLMIDSNKEISLFEFNEKVIEFSRKYEPHQIKNELEIIAFIVKDWIERLNLKKLQLKTEIENQATFSKAHHNYRKLLN